MKKINISADQLQETSKSLRRYGVHRLEGLVLWLGEMHEASATVIKVLTPPQTPIRSEHGVGYLVSGETLFELNRYLHNSGLRLIAQIHSHPTDAYHSEADDQLAIVTREGGFSLVVPDFAQGPVDIALWAVYQLHGGKWKRVSQRMVDNIFQVSGEHEDKVKQPRKRWWQPK